MRRGGSREREGISIENPLKTREKGEREELDGIFRITEVGRREQKLGFLIKLIAVRYAADKRD